MAKKPAKRYQTAGELAAAARRALNAPVRTTGRSGRHSAGRAPTAAPWHVRGGPLPWRAPRCCWSRPCAFGAWQLWGGPGGDTRPTGVADTSTPSGPADAPDGAVPAIAATVPADIRATGRLVIGVNVPYAPNEFKNSAGEIVGFDVDLMNAVAKTLGLVPDYRETSVRDASSRRCRAGTSTSGCRRSPTRSSARRRSTSSPTSKRARCGRNGPGRGSIRTPRVG